MNESPGLFLCTWYLVTWSLFLLTAFSPIAITAEHLTVIRRGMPALRPRSNVVGFHDFDIKRLAENRTNSFLLFVLF